MNTNNLKQFIRVFFKALLLISIPFFLVEIALVAFLKGGDAATMNLNSAIFRALAAAVIFGIIGVVSKNRSR